MQSLIRSKSAGVIGGRGTAGAGPGRDLLYHAHGRRTEPVEPAAAVQILSSRLGTPSADQTLGRDLLRAIGGHLRPGLSVFYSSDSLELTHVTTHVAEVQSCPVLR